jgi:hypothetical protein
MKQSLSFSSWRQEKMTDLSFNSLRMRKAGVGSPLLPSSLDQSGDSFVCVEITKVSKQIKSTAYFEKLRQISTIASFLCLLDCTLLPLLTLALPLLGILNIGHDRLEWLHNVGHGLTLFFVLPVGSMSAMTNYAVHKQKWIASMAGMGLLLVVMANSHSLPVIGHIESLHVIHHGFLHRIVNSMGCACLLGSNYLSHRHGCGSFSRKECCLIQTRGACNSIV